MLTLIFFNDSIYACSVVAQSKVLFLSFLYIWLMQNANKKKNDGKFP